MKTHISILSALSAYLKKSDKYFRRKQRGIRHAREGGHPFFRFPIKTFGLRPRRGNDAASCGELNPREIKTDCNLNVGFTRPRLKSWTNSKNSIFTVVLITFVITSVQFASAQTAKEILQKAIDLMYGKKTYSVVTMTITKPTWSRTVSMKAWSIEPDYSIVYITEPARDKGSVTLKRKNEVWNWLPSVQKTIKIPPSMMLASWMGSDFTNDDLVRQSSIVNDYEHKLLGEEKYEGYDCYTIELIPKPDAGVVWGKIITWITKKEYMQLKEEFYDEDGVLVRTMLGSKPKLFDGHLLPSYSEMIPHNKPGNKTSFETKELDFDVNITPGFFSIQNMSRVR